MAKRKDPRTGIQPAMPARATAKAPLVVPPYFKAALEANPEAGAAFQAFSDSHKKEYLEWVNSAKKEDTRQRRLEQALVMMGGKSRHRECQ